MQKDGLNLEHLKDEYIICSCEGVAEKTIIDLLLDHDSLIFNKDNLVKREVTCKRSVRDIQSAFLNKGYEKRVNIIRILDSPRDTFKLGHLYVNRFPVHNIYTLPEIEMQLIIAEG